MRHQLVYGTLFEREMVRLHMSSRGAVSVPTLLAALLRPNKKRSLFLVSYRPIAFICDPMIFVDNLDLGAAILNPACYVSESFKMAAPESNAHEDCFMDRSFHG